MRAAYLGPQGTFSEEALLATAPPGTEPVPLPTVDAVVRAVQDGDAERGVVPIESATEGSVDATLDALADATAVTIVAEVVRPISHALIARTALALEDVTTVASHPQALAQCSAFLREELPWATALAWSSTAEAVLETAARREPWAAIGTPRAAELYGCVVLRDGIGGRARNETRFVWIAPSGTAVERPTKASLAFWGAGAGEPGWLVRCLSEFAFRGVNLTRIESRPRKDRLGQYLFFVDLAGAVEDERVGAAIDGLRTHCDEVRVLGSYPAA